jgi:hypothetical protein
MQLLIAMTIMLGRARGVKKQKVQPPANVFTLQERQFAGG